MRGAIPRQGGASGARPSGAELRGEVLVVGRRLSEAPTSRAGFRGSDGNRGRGLGAEGRERGRRERAVPVSRLRAP